MSAGNIIPDLQKLIFIHSLYFHRCDIQRVCLWHLNEVQVRRHCDCKAASGRCFVLGENPRDLLRRRLFELEAGEYLRLSQCIFSSISFYWITKALKNFSALFGSSFFNWRYALTGLPSPSLLEVTFLPPLVFSYDMESCHRGGERHIGVYRYPYKGWIETVCQAIPQAIR